MCHPELSSVHFSPPVTWLLAITGSATRPQVAKVLSPSAYPPVVWCSANAAHKHLKPSVDICSFIASPCQTMLLKEPHQQDGMSLTMQCPKHEVPVSSQKSKGVSSGVKVTLHPHPHSTAEKLEGN